MPPDPSGRPTGRAGPEADALARAEAEVEILRRCPHTNVITYYARTLVSPFARGHRGRSNAADGSRGGGVRVPEPVCPRQSAVPPGPAPRPLRPSAQGWQGRRLAVAYSQPSCVSQGGIFPYGDAPLAAIAVSLPERCQIRTIGPGTPSPPPPRGACLAGVLLLMEYAEDSVLNVMKGLQRRQSRPRASQSQRPLPPML